MWEEWRAHIDKTVRDAEVGRTAVDEDERAFRDFSVTRLPRGGGQTPRDVPKHWRVRLSAAKARPVL